MFVFGKDGVKNVSQDLNENFLGEIPLNGSICESSDVGRPCILQDNTDLQKIFANIVDKTEDIIKSNNAKSKKVKISDNSPESSPTNNIL